MSKVIDYYFAPHSPWTYLGHDRLVALARRHDARIAYKVADLGRVFAVSGGLPLGKRAPQRQAYRLVELARWRDFLGVPLTLKPKFFPVNPDRAAHLILAAESQGRDPGPLTGALLRAVWAEERDIADPATLAAICATAGLDGAALAAAAAAPEIAARYDALTAEAIERGVFGAPTFVFRDELFWGQDRLDFLDRALGSAA